MSNPPYTLLEGGRAIQCNQCEMVSHNMGDIQERYCGNCNRFHDDGTGEAIPEDVLASIQAMSMDISAEIATGREVVPKVTVIRRRDKQVWPMIVDMGDNTERDAMAETIRLFADEKGADCVVLFSEAWGMPDVPMAEAEALMEQYGAVSKMPNRVEILLITVETPTHFWMSKEPITGSGANRRVGPPLFTLGEKGSGRFTQFLSTPAQKAARASFLDELDKRIASVGLDPATVISHPEGEFTVRQLVQRVLVKHPDAPLDKARMDAVVLGLLYMQIGAKDE